MPPWFRRRREGAILLIHRDPGRFEHFVTLGEPSAEPPWWQNEAGDGAANTWHGDGDDGGDGGGDGGDGDDFGPESLTAREARRGLQEIGPSGEIWESGPSGEIGEIGPSGEIGEIGPSGEIGREIGSEVDDLEARLDGRGLPRLLPSSPPLRLPRRAGHRSSPHRYGLGLGGDRQQAAPPEPKRSDEARREARRLQRQPIHVIGRAMYETSGVPPDWAGKCNEWVDEVRLPSAPRLHTAAPTCRLHLSSAPYYSLLTTTHHSPLTTHHSPLTTHHSPLTTYY